MGSNSTCPERDASSRISGRRRNLEGAHVATARSRWRSRTGITSGVARARGSSRNASPVDQGRGCARRTCDSRIRTAWGSLISIGDMRVSENDPPVERSDAQGPVRILGDTVFLTLHHFDLPGSTGHAQGRDVSGAGPCPRTTTCTCRRTRCPWRRPHGVPDDSAHRRASNWSSRSGTTFVTRMCWSRVEQNGHALHEVGSHRSDDVRGRISGARGDECDAEFSPLDFDLLRTLAAGRSRRTGEARSRHGARVRRAPRRWHVDDGR